MKKPKKILLLCVTCLFLIVGILSTYYYTYSEAYYRDPQDYGPTKIFKGTEIFINIQMTQEGHKKTFFGNEYRSPYSVSFVFKGKKDNHRSVEITSCTVEDSHKRQNLIENGNSLSENFQLWPNGTWGTSFETQQTFKIDFMNETKLFHIQFIKTSIFNM